MKNVSQSVFLLDDQGAGHAFVDVAVKGVSTSLGRNGEGTGSTGIYSVRIEGGAVVTGDGVRS